ncbi:hypothetical protein ACLD0U_07320 [Microbacterium sp. 2216-1]|uniref:hypothetical protein n=1 Tax=Microbacterium sp. 2216-1 TaxID=3390053 RepID=UPI003975EB5A
MLSAHGETSEADIELRDAFAAISGAVYLSARRGERNIVETIAAELHDMGRGEIAEDILDQIPNSRNEISASSLRCDHDVVVFVHRKR